MTIDLRYGDCLELMKNIPNGSIDAIITDPPYGTTACKWDSIIPFDLMWEQLNRIIKSNGAIILFGQEPFSSFLRVSNIKKWRYDWIWEKNKPTNFGNANKMPLKSYEIISVFYNSLPTYNPQGLIDIAEKTVIRNKNEEPESYGKTWLIGEFKRNKTNFPRQNLKFGMEAKNVHPTQKPIELMEYLTKTYTNENELVLDFTMGSCTTGIACINTKRNFIGIENNMDYFNISLKRVEEKRKEKDFNVVTSFGDGI
jgi:site-specific DNA-methyltransferase (adenine-specific)